MVFGDPIFEIAIYRKSPDALEKEQETIFEKQVRLVESRLAGSGVDYRSSDTYEYSRNRFFEEYGSPYPYNQIVGWIVLIASYDNILAEYFKITEKRFTRKCRQYPFMWQGKAFEIHFTGNETNKEIVNEILKELRLLSLESPFKKRFIDKTAFEQIAPYVDWKKLMKDSP